MATMNPFDLLGDDDNDDVSQLVEKIAAAPPKKAPPAAAGKAAAPPAKLPSKPLPPAQAVREARNEGGRGGRGGRGYGRGGRGGRGYDRDSANNEGSFGNRAISGGQGGTEESNGRPFERRGGYGGPRGGFRRQGSFGNGDAEDGERPRRTYDRRSGTGYGNEFKREGAGRGNWGTQADEINHEIQEAVVEAEKTVDSDKPVLEEEATDVKKENASPENVEEPENKEMTLEEYQKVLEEKRKALAALKTEERKVEVDKDLASMQQLSNKKTSDEIFVKLGSDKDKRKEIAEKEERTKKEMTLEEYQKVLEEKRKALAALKTEERKVEVDKDLASMQQLSNKKTSDEIFVKLGSDKDKRKEIAEKEERTKKSLSINEFLKPAEGERQYTSGGRGRGRGGRGGGGGGGRFNQGGGSSYAPEAPKIEDPSHFPTLGGK